jgi:hypothetical protein
MSEVLTDLHVACLTCLRINTYGCGNPRCVRCIVDKMPSEGCGGIELCRKQMVKQMRDCTNYKPTSWDR